MSEHSKKEMMSSDEQLPSELRSSLGEKDLAMVSGGLINGAKVGYQTAQILGTSKGAQVKSAVYGLVRGSKKAQDYALKHAPSSTVINTAR